MVIKKNLCSHEIGAQRPSSTDSDRQESRQIAGSLALQSSEAKPFSYVGRRYGPSAHTRDKVPRTSLIPVAVASQIERSWGSSNNTM